MATKILVNLSKKSDFYNKFNNHKINDKLSEYIYFMIIKLIIYFMIIKLIIK